MDAKQLESQYKNHLSNYRQWDQLSHAQDWILFEKNISSHVGLDETSLSNGELYTILINKHANVIGNFESSKNGKVKSS